MKMFALCANGGATGINIFTDIRATLMPEAPLSFRHDSGTLVNGPRRYTERSEISNVDCVETRRGNTKKNSQIVIPTAFAGSPSRLPVIADLTSRGTFSRSVRNGASLIRHFSVQRQANVTRSYCCGEEKTRKAGNARMSSSVVRWQKSGN